MGRLRPGEWRLVVRWLVAAALMSVLLDALLPNSVLAGDPRLFNVRADDLLSGQLPYIEAEFEHLPVMIPFVVVGRLLTELMPGQSPALAYLLMMTVVTTLTTMAVVRTGRDLGHEDPLRRWIPVASPILPIVLFRLDPIPTGLAAAGMASFVAGNAAASARWSLLGAAAKGWPLVMAVPLWWSGERRRAGLAVGAFAALVAALLLTPGFRSGRAYDGVHTETIVGSATLLGRNTTGEDLGLIEAAWSIYIAVPPWAPLVHLAVGGSLAVWAISRRPIDPTGALARSGAVVAGAIVASPLLSSQFVFWLAPFVALVGSRRTRWLYVGVGVASTLLIAHWRLDTVWWPAAAQARVWGVVLVGVLLVVDQPPATVPVGEDRDRARATTAV